ncbi:penicillin acylase family protein [Marivirga sp. S37H4]|uniref:Penicillin acylase family protein n=1 Tax=Marivirga aurantiaca TaxID=2802615 RepID=A0A935C6Y6_9BACT|nr:penicillin acylase family protein [Marivirga aurantiaca]MBK6264701.1 penicillin acylase family protein [Marivirga aurantiaca]
MKFIKFLFSFIIAVALVVGLNEKWGQVPPLGKFLDPYNGFWANSENKEITFDEKIVIEELKEEVAVHYDSILIPHVFAKNDADLYMTQGYVTALNRLWQMEFQTHASAGRVSEIIGGDALDFDRYQRRNGLLYAAENGIKSMEEDPVVGPLLNAYTTGINSFINSLSYKELPLEYKLLNYKPEPWTNLKSALLLKYMANDLAGSDVDIENTHLLKILGKDRFDFLFPDRYANMDPVIPKEKKWDFKPLPINRPDSIAFPLVFPDEEGPQPNPDNGSNNWVVSGKKTSSGKPILANDPHLGLNLPSIWYVMHLNAPGINTYGGTLPGAMGVIIGFNDSIAWGETNATRDVRDWYHIQFKDADKTEYFYNDKWLKTQKIVQTFKIRGEKEFTDTIYYTHHGPIVYDENYKGENDKANFALRWTAHDPSNEQLTFHLLNRAKNYNEYKEALSYYETPAQNFAFASVQGDIALWVNGKFPLRWEEQGKFIMDGSRADMDWAGFIPHEHNAFIKNPKQGFISSANQIPVDSTYPYYHYDKGYEHYRNRRINTQLATLQNITIEDMKRLQTDNYNLFASEILPAMLDSLDKSKLNEVQKKAFDVLSNWDFISHKNAVAPTYFEIWWDEVYKCLWDEFLVKDNKLRKPELPVTVEILKYHSNDPFIDNKNTDKKESIADLYLSGFKSAVDSVENWKSEKELELNWSNFKNTTIQHLARLPAFSTERVPIGGNKHIVNATSARHGASWRMIVSMENPIKAYGVYPGGQSGNPGSYYYDNMIDRWSRGEYYQLDYNPQAESLKNIIFTQTLTPSEE